MKSLAINTASSISAIALLEDGKIISERSWPSANDEAEKLMPAIEEMLAGDFAQIDNVLVVRGPGSFTGLRIGVATANAFASLQQKPLYAIDAFQYWWKTDIDQDSDAALLIFAGKGGVYISHSEIGKLYELEDAKEYLQQQGIKKIFGDISQQQKEFFADFEFIDNKTSFAQTIVKFDLKEMTIKKLVEPLYIKAPAITLSKKKLID